MKIKILQKSTNRMWYDAYIGWTFQVERISPQSYWVREHNEYSALNFVKIEDCEVVDYAEFD